MGGLVSPVSEMASPKSIASLAPSVTQVRARASDVLANASAKIEEFNTGSDMSFVKFTSYIVLLFVFTLLANVFITVVESRARSRGLGLPGGMVVLQYLWISF